MINKNEIANREEQLLREGAAGDWQSIFKSYVLLAEQGDLEAAKRALFFIWYEQSEPSALSRISSLDETLKSKVLAILNSLFSKGEFDAELLYMSKYYYSIADWYIPDAFKYPELVNLSLQNGSPWMEGVKSSSFSGRGKMGRYWDSLKLNS